MDHNGFKGLHFRPLRNLASEDSLLLRAKEKGSAFGGSSRPHAEMKNRQRRMASQPTVMMHGPFSRR